MFSKQYSKILVGFQLVISVLRGATSSVRLVPFHTIIAEPAEPGAIGTLNFWYVFGEYYTFEST